MELYEKYSRNRQLSKLEPGENCPKILTIKQKSYKLDGEVLRSQTYQWKGESDISKRFQWVHNK